MRRLLSGFLSLGLLTATAVQARAACGSPADQQVFDVQALKSMLIVLATSCHVSDPYNAFVNRYKSELAGDEKAFDAYFKRVYGRRAQAEHDSYITSLANEQFDAGIKQGQDFCPRNAAIYTEVMSLRGPDDLPPYAAGKNLIPASLGACESGPAREVHHVATTRKAKR